MFHSSPISGSEFVELFRYKVLLKSETYSNRQKKAHMIVFIDEIDAIGGREKCKWHGWKHERERRTSTSY